ncbi:ATP synthase subunit I [Paenibacillus sp. 7124]|uniref:ATP synthase subunit I n=1 Tax=Paenibacillus apii TaxID=1850370 RepID=A0A6M1PFU0_9BACL|nr:ATP synthase subunit I [Paenibacillus apii]NGM82267.1 ATP synthase subunit I [Paenibacillus apii]NJJ39404.1 ATP synthase subunit I [Paenibacillus apii]
MNDESRINRLMFLTIMGIVAACLIIAELMPHRRTVFHGVVLGAIVSCINVFYMAHKVKGIGKSVTGESKKRASLGFGVRSCISILAIVLALEFPHYFNEIAVLASLMTGYFVLPIVGFFLLMSENRKDSDRKG